MAQRRMFNKTITNNDNFLEMPDSSQNLYFHLSMNADDDGFVDNWKSIIRMTGHKEDDLKILIAKQYIIPFESGVIVIRHWRLNNYLQKDRITPTNYKEEKALLTTDLNNVYNLDTKCIHSIDKNSIDKNKKDILPDKKEPEICNEIIEYLNLKANTKFRSNSAATKRHLNARLAEGFTIDDFKKVIDVKCTQWLNDPNMKKYLRPETLFTASHFESYLNEYVEPPRSKYSDALERMNKHMEEKQKEAENIDMGDFY